MSIRVEGLDELQQLMVQIESEGRRRAVASLIESANDLQKLARAMAPVDFGNLEDAIKVDVSPNRNAKGQFSRQVVQVYVDLDYPADQRKAGKTVGDYAYYVHEHMTPVGPGGLGPKSREKQKSQPSVIVGGGYLERAAAKIEEQAVRKVAQALQDYTRG